MTAAILSGHRLVRPHGMAGGGEGVAGRNLVERQDGSVVELGPSDRTEMGAGDVFIVESPGGGGFGPPE
jgi:5-oxoprolinase (ATP-hydrolysing)